MTVNVPDRRALALLIVAAAGIAGVVLYGPIPQDPAYHAFADRRTILGVPHFWNVVSNAPFAAAGLLGLAAILRGGRGLVPSIRAAYVLFFVGAILVAFGSGWYHLDPSTPRLVWDRLPMTIALMALFTIVIGEHVSTTLARRALAPLLAVGIASAAYWGLTERWGRGDLRAYAIVQFLPIALTPLILLLYRSRLDRVGFLWFVLLSNGAAKAFELLDAPLKAATGVSGHPLKHVAAAIGVAAVAWAVHARRPVTDEART